MDGISIFYQNVRGMKTKSHEILMSILSSDYDIICLTETWLDDSFFSSEYFDKRYTVVRRDRSAQFKDLFSKSYGGGILLAISNKYNFVNKIEWQTSVEDMWLCISGGGVCMNICVVYLPSYIPCHIFVEFLTRAEEICLRYMDCTTLIIGDFNLPNVKWRQSSDPFLGISDPKSLALRDFLNITGFVQMNNVSNVNDNILDLILVDVNTCLSVSSAPPISKPDVHHPPLELALTKTSFSNLNYNILQSKYIFIKTDYEACVRDLHKVNWEDYCHLSCNDYVLTFYNILWENIDKYTPKGKPKNNCYPVWFSASLIKLLKEKHKYRIRFKRYKNPRDYDTFNALRMRAGKAMDNCFRDYIGRIESELKTNMKAFWRYTKSKKSYRGVPDQVSWGDRVGQGGSGVVDLFADFFASVYGVKQPNDWSPGYSSSNYSLYSIGITENDVRDSIKKLDLNKGAGPDGLPPIFIRLCIDALVIPLQIIYNKSLKEGTFPDLWKISHIIPIHKSGSMNDVTNYRPISIISQFAKIFEGLIYNVVYSHLRHLISSKQHGFVSNRSTMSNLLIYNTFIAETFEARGQVDAVYTDFEKAFDRVDHSILSRKLNYSGIHGSLLRWFESYLTNRSQIVALAGYESVPFSPSSGVPQGSKLGPLLFLVFLNDLLDLINSNCLAYADDLKIYCRISDPSDCARLQRDLDVIQQWCLNNRMTLNVKKCQTITFTNKMNYIKYDYHIDGSVLTRVSVIRDLGVLFDTSLSFRHHIENIVSKAKRMLGFIIRMSKPFRNCSSIILLYNALVRSSLEYCSTIWSPYYSLYINDVESVQARFVRYLCVKNGIRKAIPDYNDRLRHFKMISLKERRDHSDLLILHKIINGAIDAHLVNYFNFRYSKRSKRHHNIFELPKSTLNTTFNSPLTRMARQYNERSNLTDYQIDIFSMSFVSYRRSLLKNCD